MNIAQGAFIADRYEVISKVGAGGMSDVYKAKDHILGREVAVKILKAEFSEDATFVAKFRTEAQSAASLEHPNIVNIYDVGSENGMYFIVMEYVEGITLKTYIEKKGQLNFKEAISIAIQVGRGIEAAHSKGIIHRDIKPQNIIISTEGKVKVTDFGIARAASSNTIHADVMGSVHYSSPEQARSGFVDGKSDIYSLGIVMYEMVTGRVPFDGDSTVAIAIQHLQEEMVAPSAYAPDLPISLEKIILKATMKSPDRRYNTISDMLIDLKKSLVSPNEDFVNIVDTNSLANTRVASQEEQASITKKAAEALQLDFVDEYDGKKDEVRNFNANRRDFYDDDDYDDGYDDGYEDDDDDGKSDKIMTILGIVAGIAIVVILIVILGNVFGLFNFSSSNKIAMIDVVGEEYETAVTDLTKAGFDKENITVEYQESSTYNDGIVTDQSVDEGKKIKADAEITLTVAGSGDSSDSSSDSSDKSTDSSDSSDSSSDKKDSSTETKTDSSSTTTDTTTSKDTTTTTTTTTTDTSSSSSSKTVNVPSVAGLSQADATNTLQNAKLIVTSVTSEYSDNVEEGKVISQSIAAGQQVAENTNITLVVSKGKKAETYTVYCINPYADDATYTLETGQTGSVKGSGTVTVNNSPKAQLSCTFSHTVTDETTGEKKTEEQTLTFTGTAN